MRRIFFDICVRRVSVVVVAMICTGVAVPAASQTYAVIDFEDRRVASGGTDSLMAVGLADYFETLLRFNGTPLLERQAISDVLGERRLSNLLGRSDADAELPALPGADRAIRGSIGNAADGRLEVKVEWFDTRTGTLVGRATRDCGTEDALADALEQIAFELAGVSDPLERAAFIHRRPEGFTESPEAALWFYRGLDAAAQSRHGRAIACLDQALMSDPGFVIAELWLIRTLRRAGLPDFAQGVLDEATATRRADLERRLESTREWRNNDQTTVAVMATSVESRSRADDIEQAFVEAPGFRVINEQGAVASVRERDLRLSGEFDALPVVVDRWLFADVFIRVGPQVATAYWVDTGQKMDEIKIEHAATPDWVVRSTADKSFSKIVEFDPAERITFDPEGTDYFQAALGETATASPSDRQPRRADTIGRVTRTAALIDRVLREPNNLTAYWALAKTYRPFSTQPACARMIRLIDVHRTVPDAAFWLSHVLYTRFERRFHYEASPVGYKCFDEPGVAERFAELIAWFPESDAVALLDYVLAQEAMSAGEHERAVELMGRLDRRWDRLVLPGRAKLRDDYRINLLYRLAYAQATIGRTAEARRALDRCMRLTQKTRDDGRVIKVVGRLQIWAYDDRVRWSMQTKASHSHAAYLHQRLNDLRDLRPRIHFLDRHLRAVSAGRVLPGPPRGAAELFVAATREADPNLRYELQHASVQAALQNPELNISLEPRVIRQIAWLRLRCESSAQHQAINRLIEAALQHPVSIHQRHQLLCLSGRFTDARNELKYLDAQLGGATSRERLCLNVELDSLTLNRQNLGATLIGRLDEARSQADGEVGRAAPTRRESTQVSEQQLRLGYIHRVQTLAPFLMDVGFEQQVIDHLEPVEQDATLPQIFRLRSSYQRALALARSGRIAEAAARLSRVGDAAATLSDLDQQAYFAERRPRVATWLKAIPPAGLHDLAFQARDDLYRLRLYGGQPESRIRSLASETPGLNLFDDGRYDRATLYAALIGLSTQTYHRDYYGENWWAHECLARLAAMGDAAGPILRRLTAAIYSPDGKTLDIQRGSRKNALFLLAWCSADQQLPADRLIEWMIWSPVCSVKYNAGRCLRKTELSDDRLASFLTLASSMIGGCEASAREGFERLDTTALSPTAIRRLTELLDHPLQEVRRRAATLLADRWAITLHKDPQDRPTDEAIAVLRGFAHNADAKPTKDHALALAGHLAKPPRSVIDADFSRDGNILATTGPGPVACLWDLRNASTPQRLDHGKSNWVSLVRLSPDGRYAVTFAQDQFLRFWDTAKPEQPAQSWALDIEPLAIALSPRGTYVASNAMGICRVYDTKTGALKWERKLPTDAVATIRFSPDERWLMTEVDRYDAVGLIEVASGVIAHRFIGFDTDVADAAWLDGGRWALLDAKLMVRTVDPERPRQIQHRFDRLSSPPTHMDVSADHQFLLTAHSDGRLAVWPIHLESDASPMHQFAISHRDARAVTWAGERRARLAYDDGEVIEVDLESGLIHSIVLGQVSPGSATNPSD
ncbi:MAG: hypothetical protein AAF086_03335 [Planctomycetota bacterium]